MSAGEPIWYNAVTGNATYANNDGSVFIGYSSGDAENGNIPVTLTSTSTGFIGNHTLNGMYSGTGIAASDFHTYQPISPSRLEMDRMRIEIEDLRNYVQRNMPTPEESRILAELRRTNNGQLPGRDAGIHVVPSRVERAPNHADGLNDLLDATAVPTPVARAAMQNYIQDIAREDERRLNLARVEAELQTELARAGIPQRSHREQAERAVQEIKKEAELLKASKKPGDRKISFEL